MLDCTSCWWRGDKWSGSGLVWLKKDMFVVVVVEGDDCIYSFVFVLLDLRVAKQEIGVVGMEFFARYTFSLVVVGTTTIYLY
jgi:hypothetical protein